MSHVFGTARHPAYVIPRRDRQGRPVSLAERIPEAHTILITGGPGMGKTLELDRAEALARELGWTSVRVEASEYEPLEARFVRAVEQNLGTIRKQHGVLAAQRLKRGLQELVPASRNPQNGFEIRAGLPTLQAVMKRQWDGRKQGVGRTLNELVDQLGELAAKKKEPVLLMVDNVDAGHRWDATTLVELAAHLEARGKPVFLVTAGGEQAMTRLMEASAGPSGTPTGITSRIDVRECLPLGDDELRPAVTAPLRAAGIGYDSEAVTQLVEAANGNPGRLRDLADTALRIAPNTIDGPAARQAIKQHHERSRVVYQGLWNSCGPQEKELLAKVAARGARGLSMASETQAAGPERWTQVDEARQALVAKGLLRDTGERVRVADPGLRDWVAVRAGQVAANAGVALPGSPGPARLEPESASRHTSEGRQTTTRQLGNHTFSIVKH